MSKLHAAKQNYYFLAYDQDKQVITILICMKVQPEPEVM